MAPLILPADSDIQIKEAKRQKTIYTGALRITLGSSKKSRLIAMALDKIGNRRAPKLHLLGIY